MGSRARQLVAIAAAVRNILRGWPSTTWHHRDCCAVSIAELSRPSMRGPRRCRRYGRQRHRLACPLRPSAAPPPPRLNRGVYCTNAMLPMRVPVHGVGGSDRPNRVYSDRKCIFCEYLALFAAYEEHAVARARVDEARGFMMSPACTLYCTACATSLSESE